MTDLQEKLFMWFSRIGHYELGERASVTPDRILKEICQEPIEIGDKILAIFGY